jgi:hypothetical protein
MLRILSLGFGALLFVAAVTQNGSLYEVFDVPSTLLVVVGTFAIVGGTHGLAGCNLLIRAQVLSIAAKDLPRLRAAIRTGVRAVWLTGGLGTLIGAIQILSYVGRTDDMSAFGTAVAVMLLTLLYSGLLHLFVFLPLERHFDPVQG